MTSVLLYAVVGGAVTALVIALVNLGARFWRGRRHARAGCAYLQWDSGGLEQNYKITWDTTSLGRHESNDLALQNRLISRFHARIVRTSLGHYYIEDNKSSNHVYVGGKPVGRARLEEGTVFTIWPLYFKFTFDPPASGVPAGANAWIDDSPSRRKDDRESSEVTVRYYSDQTGWKRGIARNISGNGMYIDTTNKKLKEEDKIELILSIRISGQIRWLRFHGTVTHQSEGGIGIALEAIDSDLQRLLTQIDQAA